MPMSVELRILVSIMYSTQVTMPGMTDGITPWNTVWMKFAPDAWSASIQEELASSMVSINARVSIPNVVKNRAKNPVRMFCPKENIRSIAQTTSGTFRKKAAMIRTMRFMMQLRPVDSEPNRLSANANTAAITVTATESSAVSRKISIDCTGVEDALDVTMAQRSELDYLIYNDPLGYADLILNGEPEEYLKNVVGSHGLED